jgi:hypothetical protein
MFGALDKVVCSDFQERFPSVPERIDREQGYQIIPDAVHALSTFAAHEAAIEASLEWLQDRLGITAEESDGVQEFAPPARIAS